VELNKSLLNFKSEIMQHTSICKGLLAILLCFFFAAPTAFSQKPPKKAELKIQVSGNCGMCEKRINEALDLPGVIFSGWDRVSKTATIVYKPRKISEQQLHEKIAAVGHDTDKMKADTAVYKKLPGCCLYRDNANTHWD
jgi:copper chaperone CopZ